MTKLKQFLSQLDNNPIYLSSCNGAEIDRRLLHSYKQSGWIDSLGHGAFIKSGVAPSLSTAVNALQEQAHVPCHVGGFSALNEFHDVHQYLRDDEAWELYSTRAIVFPGWFKKVFSRRYESIRTSFLPDGIGIEKMKFEGVDIRVSSLERAFLEMLYSKQCSTVEAYEMLELIPILKPGLLNKLLVCCNSIRVKRLFYYLSSRVNFAWVNQLDWSQVKMGSGVRVIDDDGIFDKASNLIVKPVTDRFMKCFHRICC